MTRDDANATSARPSTTRSTRMRRSLARASAVVSIAAVVTLSFAVAGPASAATRAEVDPPASGDVLSPRLQSLQSTGIAADSPAAAESLGVTSSGAGSLQVDAQARVAVNIRYLDTPTDADVAQVAAVGDVRSIARDYDVITAYVPVSALDALRANPAVASIAEVVQPAVGGAGIPRASATASSAASAGSVASTAAVAPSAATAAVAPSAATAATDATTAASPSSPSCRSIPVDADGPLNSAEARAAFGVDGTGVSVGVISNSFDVEPNPASTAAEDVANGLLPGPANPCGYTTPVTVLAEAVVNPDSPPTDEGRAMAQLVHGVAPGAELMFATSGESSFTMASSIDTLVANGAKVIVDDITLLDDPIFQGGPVDAAIHRARAAGVLYLSSAGNASVAGASTGSSAGKQIGSWATTAYRPTACPDAVVSLLRPADRPLSDCENFAQTGAADPTDGFTFSGGRTPAMFMQWAEPLNGVHGSFAFALINHDTQQAEVASYQSDPSSPSVTAGFSDQNPTSSATTYDLVIVRTRNAADPLSDITPALKFVYVQGSGLRSAEYDTSTGDDTVGPTITGHASSRDAITVAASPYTKATTPESFSSTGPVIHYFETASGSHPAAALASPDTIAKPDVTSVDGVRNSVLGSPTSTPGALAFFGTSAAAPNAAAVVALATEYAEVPDADTIEANLMSTSTPLTKGFDGVAQHDVTGAGLVDADALLNSLVAPSPTPTPTPQPTTTAQPGPGPRPSASATPIAVATQLAKTGAGAVPIGVIGAAGLAAVLGAALIASLRTSRRRSSVASRDRQH